MAVNISTAFPCQLQLLTPIDSVRQKKQARFYHHERQLCSSTATRVFNTPVNINVWRHLMRFDSLEIKKVDERSILSEHTHTNTHRHRQILSDS